MEGVLKKRIALHRRLAAQQEQNSRLHSQLTEMQPLVNMGIISSMIAHEINNLLTPLGNYAQLALENPDDRQLITKALKKTMRNCERVRKIQESMLAMAHGRTQQKEETQLASLISEIFSCLCRDFSKDHIKVNMEIPEDLKICAVTIQIQHVLMNLILNAREAMLPKGGVLTIRASNSVDAVWIEVSDTGCGISPDNMSNIFEPFFTTKKTDSVSSRAAKGLGLAFCREIIRAHNGVISVNSEPGRGTTFKVVLPRHET